MFYSGLCMAKVKIQLQQLERQVHETTFLSAEQFVQEGRVEQLKEVEKGLWQARVMLDTTYEIDVMMRGDRVHDFYCGCSRGIKQLPCPHLVAVLLVLRGFRQQQQARRKAEKEATLPALQIRTMLNRVPESDLHQFVREWAKEDPTFAQAIKARFFMRLHASQPSHYLDSLFSTFQDGDGQLDNTPKALHELHRLFRQVLAQAAQLLLDSRSESGYALLEYLTSLLTRVDQERWRRQMIRSILQLLQDQDLQTDFHPQSPRFRFLMTCFHQLVQLGEEDAVHLVLLLLQQYSGFPEARSAIARLMKAEIERSARTRFNPEPLVLVYYQNLTREERDEDWMAGLNLPRLGPLFYTRLARTLLDSGDFTGCGRILNTGQAIFPESAELLRLQIQLSWELHRTDDLPLLAQKLILISLSEEDIHFLREYMPSESITPLFHSLTAQLDASHTFEQNLIRCILWAELEGWDPLGQQIIQSGSFRLLERFGDQLLNHLGSRYDPFVIQFLTTYLDRHVGPQAKQLIRKTRAFLIQQGQLAAERRLLAALQERYPHRSNLFLDQENHQSERL